MDKGFWKIELVTGEKYMIPAEYGETSKAVAADAKAAFKTDVTSVKYICYVRTLGE